MASEEVTEKIKLICKNNENANQIQDFLTALEGGSNAEVKESIDILFGVFSYHLKVGTWTTKEVSAVNNKDDKRVAKDILSSWLSSSYVAYLTLLSQKARSESTQIQCKAVENFLQILSAQYEAGREKGEVKAHFTLLIRELISSKNLSDELMNSLSEMMQCLDIQFYFLKKIPQLFEKKDFETSERVAENTLKILYIITENQVSVDEEATLHFLQDDTSFRKSYKQVFSNAWLALLRLNNMTSLLRKKVLIDLDSKVIPHLNDPKVLIDFLTDSYTTGGVTSLLALNSLFILINQHNLDYPDFYVNLYKIIDPSIFHMKYKSRFFHSIDLFLSSTHLPAYLIAAFIKKFSRMLLFTPAPDLMMMLTLIKNLLVRHPSSHILIHRKISKDQSDVKSDPYNYDEPTLSKCGAMDSCLWEVDTLFSHFSSEVKKVVASFRKDLPKQEADLSEHFEIDYEELFNMKIDKFADSGKEVPVNFGKSVEMFESLDKEMWVIE